MLRYFVYCSVISGTLVACLAEGKLEPIYFQLAAMMTTVLWLLAMTIGLIWKAMRWIAKPTTVSPSPREAEVSHSGP
jgi:hypothetical protein